MNTEKPSEEKAIEVYTPPVAPKAERKIEDVKLPEIASVHEKTVQKIANGDHKPPKRPKKRAKPVKKATTTRDFKVDPRVMEKAKELAEGDTKRLQIVDATNVIVLHPGQKKFNLKEER